MPINTRVLIELTITIIAVPTMLLIAAFVVLRITQPDLPRAFHIPGGLPVALLLALPPAVLTAAQFVLAISGSAPHPDDEDDEPPLVILGWRVDYPSLLCTGVVVGLGVVVHLLAIGSEKWHRWRARSGGDDGSRASLLPRERRNSINHWAEHARQ